MIVLAAAAVAQTVFGLTLGQPLTLPECQRSEFSRTAFAGEQPVVCQENYPPFPANPWASNFIVFPLAEAPKLSSSSIMGAWVQGGNLIGLQFDTIGIESQDIVLAELSTKFGKPSTVTRLPVTTPAGASYSVLHAQWSTGNIVVELEGATGRVDRGRVRIMTAEAKRLDEAAQAERDSKRTKL